MQCPKCGYVLSAFDADCPRCAKLAQEAAKQPAAIVPVSPSRTAPQPRQVVTPIPHAVSINCTQCGSSNVRKVSAIVQSETWSSRTDRNSVKVGRYGYGIGATTGHSSTVTNRASNLAQVLMPPSSPSFPSKPHYPAPKRDMPGRGAIWGALGFGCNGVLCLPLMGIVWLFSGAAASTMFYFFFGSAFLLIISGIVLNNLKSKEVEEKHNRELQHWQQNQQAALTQWEQRCAGLQTRWERAMFNWDSLFHCSRCDHVYNPQTGEAAPANSMRHIL